MSQINVNRIKDSNEGAPDFPSGVNVSGVTSTVTLGVTNLNTTNVNVSGVVTATTLDGNLLATGTPTLGLGVTINTSGLNISGVATAGIVCATTLYGDGSNLTGIALSIAPLNYNPSINDMKVTEATGIGLTFNQGVKAGSGNVTLSLVSVGSTLVENFSVGSSVSYADSDYGTTVTISPTSSLSQNTVYALSYPSGSFTNLGGDVSYVGTAYTFKTILQQYTLWAWGANSGGALAQNNTTSYSSPVQIPGTIWGDVGGVRTDGTLWTWGPNESGELGNNDRAHRSSPVQIPGTTWKLVYGGIGEGGQDSKRFAFKTDGTMWGWGWNSNGELGQNNRTTYSSPVQVGSDTTWPTTGTNKFGYSAAYNVISAIKTDGTLWMWGATDYGVLGQNETYSPSKRARSSPVQVGSETTWKSVGRGGSMTITATKTDGTLWPWGRNEFGQLGQNNTAVCPSPVQIPGTTWNIAGNGVYTGSATKTDGTLWIWGYGAYGGLGTQTGNTQYSSPVQIPGTTWSRPIAMPTYANGAIKTDGTVWVWGEGAGGILANGSQEDSDSPIQIPGTTWTDVRGHSSSARGVRLLEE